MRGFVSFLAAGVLGLAIALGIASTVAPLFSKKTFKVCYIDMDTGKVDCGLVTARSYVYKAPCVQFSDDTLVCHVEGIYAAPQAP